MKLFIKLTVSSVINCYPLLIHDLCKFALHDTEITSQVIGYKTVDKCFHTLEQDGITNLPTKVITKCRLFQDNTQKKTQKFHGLKIFTIP